MDLTAEDPRFERPSPLGSESKIKTIDSPATNDLRKGKEIFIHRSDAMKLTKGELAEGLLSSQAAARKEGPSFSPPDQVHHQSVKNFGQMNESNTVNADTEGLSFTSDNNNLYPTESGGGVLVTYFLHAVEIERLLQVNRTITLEASQLERELSHSEHRLADLEHQAGLRSAQFGEVLREAEEKDQVIFELSEKVKELEELLRDASRRPQSFSYSSAANTQKDKELQSLRRKTFELEAFVRRLAEERDQREQDLVGLLKSREEDIQRLIAQKSSANNSPQSASNSFIDGVAPLGFEYTPACPANLRSAEAQQTVESIDEKDSSFIYREDSQQLLQDMPDELKYVPAVARPPAAQLQSRPTPSTTEMLRFLFPSKLSKADLRFSILNQEAPKQSTGSLRSPFKSPLAINGKRNIFDDASRGSKPGLDPSLLEGVSVQTEQPVTNKYLLSSKSRHSEKARRAKQASGTSDVDGSSFKFQSLNISDVSKKYIQNLGRNSFIPKSKHPDRPQQAEDPAVRGRQDLQSAKQARELQRGASNPSQMQTSGADSYYSHLEYPKDHSVTKSSSGLSKYSPQPVPPLKDLASQASAFKNYEQHRDVMMKKASGGKGGPIWLSNFSTFSKKFNSVTKYS